MIRLNDAPFGKCHSINYRLCAYIRKSKKGRFYTCIFIEKDFRKALRTDNFKKKAVFVCTFRADRGKYGQNAHIKSMKKPFSYVRLSQIIVPHRSYKSNRGRRNYDFLKEAGISQILQRASYPAEGFRGDSKISCDVFLRDSAGQIREYFSEVNVSFGGVLDQEAVFSVKLIPDGLFKEYDPQILESIIA